MKVLIAEDDIVSRRMLQVFLMRWGYQVVVVTDGAEAWRVMESADPPRLAIIDWMMPLMDGVEICRRERETHHASPAYIILLTARGGNEDIVRGLDAGADDYIVKPFNREELRARVRVGVRILDLQKNLAGRVSDLERAMAGVKQLQGLLPICCYCKKIRDDQNYWQQVEGYISKHSDAQFSHGVCPECFEKIVRPELAKSSPPTATPHN
ncbi:MAG TPA: response regulator transcription factor [Terriglobia bacterium]|nr:response regulator transcription factor [Terriglobia bacterium]